MRAAVNWADEQNADFSGTIDTTAAPYNGQSEEGQTVLCVNPQTAADSGVWVLGSHTNPAAVPVTKRSDSVTGQVFKAGELIARYDRIGSDPKVSLYRADIMDNGTGYFTDEAALDGVDKLVYWALAYPVQSHQALEVQTLTVSLGLKLTGAMVRKALNVSSAGPTTLARDYPVTFADASANNVGVKLPVAGSGAEVTTSLTVKRIDSSGNTVTVSVQSGDALEGVTNGTLTLGPLQSATFESDGQQPGKWWRI